MTARTRKATEEVNMTKLNAKEYLDIISYRIPLENLYEIRKTWFSNQEDKYCAVLLEITNKQLRHDIYFENPDVN